jgi:hypothetical protein
MGTAFHGGGSEESRRRKAQCTSRACDHHRLALRRDTGTRERGETQMKFSNWGPGYDSAAVSLYQADHWIRGYTRYSRIPERQLKNKMLRPPRART